LLLPLGPAAAAADGRPALVGVERADAPEGPSIFLFRAGVRGTIDSTSA